MHSSFFLHLRNQLSVLVPNQYEKFRGKWQWDYWWPNLLMHLYSNSRINPHWNTRRVGIYKPNKIKRTMSICDTRKIWPSGLGLPPGTQHPHPNPYPYYLCRVWVRKHYPLETGSGRVIKPIAHTYQYPRLLPSPGLPSLSSMTDYWAPSLIWTDVLSMRNWPNHENSNNLLALILGHNTKELEVSI